MNQDFKFSGSKTKYVVWIILILVFSAALIMFIYTSWYENDLKITGELGAIAFDYPVIGWISDYIVREGYFTLTSVSIPLGIFLFEVAIHYLYTYFSKNKLVSFIHEYRKVVGYLMMSAWTLIIFYPLYLTGFTERGFGIGVNPRSFQPLSWSIATSILIFITNNTVCWSLGLWIMYKVTSNVKVLESDLWKRVSLYVLFLAINYYIILILKQGFGRPSYTTVTWEYQLARLKEIKPDMWQIYMNQSEFNYGLYVANSHLPGFKNDSISSIPGSFPWWKPSPTGWFNKWSNPVNGTMLSEDMFPSGHIQTSLVVISGLWVIYPMIKLQKHDKTLLTISSTLFIGYGISQFIALALTHGHWMSDSVFTIVLSGFVIILCYYINNGLVRILNWVHQKFMLPRLKNQTRVLKTKAKN